MACHLAGVQAHMLVKRLIDAVMHLYDVGQVMTMGSRGGPQTFDSKTSNKKDPMFSECPKPVFPVLFFVLESKVSGNWRRTCSRWCGLVAS